MSKTAVLLLTHTFNDLVFERFQKLEKESSHDTFLLVDSEKLESIPLLESLKKQGKVVEFTEKDLKKEFVFFTWRDPFLSFFQRLRSEKIKSIIPGNTHFPLVSFLRSHNYEFAWCIEYDVHFCGHWREFFKTQDKSASDLLSTQIIRFSNSENWYWWYSLSWLFGIPVRQSRRLSSFNPIFRLSKRAAKVIHLANHLGWKGHHEATMPTVIFSKGLKIEDIGGVGEFVHPSNYGKWYSSSSFNWKRIEFKNIPSDSLNKLLLHPVKTSLGEKTIGL